MKLSEKLKSTYSQVAFSVTAFAISATQALADLPPTNEGAKVEVGKQLPFNVPTLADLLTFVIRFFFTVAGLVALLYLLLGAFGWITSGGSKEGVEKAREKIQAAIIGVILIVLVLALVWTLEQIVFNKAICFGISCPLTLPSLLTPKTPGT